MASEFDVVFLRGASAYLAGGAFVLVHDASYQLREGSSLARPCQPHAGDGKGGAFQRISGPVSAYCLHLVFLVRRDVFSIAWLAQTFSHCHQLRIYVPYVLYCWSTVWSWLLQRSRGKQLLRYYIHVMRARTVYNYAMSCTTRCCNIHGRFLSKNRCLKRSELSACISKRSCSRSA